MKMCIKGLRLQLHGYKVKHTVGGDFNGKLGSPLAQKGKESLFFHPVNQQVITDLLGFTLFTVIILFLF